MSDQEPESTDKSQEIESTKEPTEQNAAHQIKIPQDIRYSTEQDDRDKLMKKYEDYQVSDTNSCSIRFLIDHRHKRKLLGHFEEEKSKLQSIGKLFDVDLLTAYQTSSKHSFKLSGTETNVRKCLIDVLNRIFEQQSRSSIQTNNENNDESTEVSVNVETKSINSTTTTDPNEDKINTKIDNSEESYKFIPLELEPEHTIILLITSQGQEALKKNWGFFAGPLQQRLNVTVVNPFRLPRFGDSQSQYELSITGHVHENLVDAALQITAFINDILGVSIQPYTGRQDEETTNEVDNRQHSIGIYEQIVFIRRDCIARIIGTRGSTMKRIQSKCQLRDMYIARHANENGYTECKISAYQTRNLNFAIDTIKYFLRNENQQAVQVFKPYYVDVSADQNQQSSSSSSDLHTTIQQTGFLTIPSNFDHGSQFVQPSYTFQNTPTFDFTHQATCASRENDKRSGDDILSADHGYNRSSNENSDHLNDSLSSSVSSSNSCSISYHHQSKRTCPVTKEIECTTDDGFWIRKQYYNALDDQSKQLFDSLMKKFEEIHLANEENAARKQQRLVGRNRTNKSRTFLSTTNDKDSTKEEVDESTNDQQQI